MQLLRTRAELADWLAATTGKRAVVLTMGALHAGHQELMNVARQQVGVEGTVLVTIFVNPLQFGPNEDFEKYPRSLASDLEACREMGVDAVFAPEVSEVYPDDEVTTTYDVGELAMELEGAARPGHFAGVLTVVARLLLLTHADVTCFGEKDYQQLALVRRLRTLEPRLSSCEFVGVPTKRDPDGLAQSSRNRYLSDEERQQALAVPTCVALVQAACEQGKSAAEAQALGLNFLKASAGIAVEYVEVRGSDLGPAPAVGEGRVVVAAKVGTTRLLDNGPVSLGKQSA